MGSVGGRKPFIKGFLPPTKNKNKTKKFGVSMSNICSIILAAGRGTRMPSPRPKALQSVLGETMISHVYHALEPLGADIWTVVGHGAEEVREHIKGCFGEKAHERCVLQEEQLGTGHAVLCALKAMREKLGVQNMTKGTKILVVNADTPLIKSDILQNFVERAKGIPVAFMSIMLGEPASYGRVMREKFRGNVAAIPSKNLDANTGAVHGIIEAKDFRKDFPLCEIYEVNTGIYLFDVEILEELLPQISTSNAGGEYYLTDMVSLAKSSLYMVDAICVNSFDSAINISASENNYVCTDSAPANLSANVPNNAPDYVAKNVSSHVYAFRVSSDTPASALFGVNNPQELSFAEKQMQANEIQRRLSEGIIIHAPESVRISPFVIIETGVEIFGPCEIYGKSHIGENTRIESHCYIKNTSIGYSCVVRSFCHFENASVAHGVQLGPYARLRPGAELAEDVHIGNFVEIKKSTVAKGSKINHLVYIGDSVIGSGVNIGAGCITCNYDGKNKHQTTIEDNAFLGSNCAFIAPVKIGKNALIGAGSVITKDVPDHHLAIARGKQVMLKK